MPQQNNFLTNLSFKNNIKVAYTLFNDILAAYGVYYIFLMVLGIFKFAALLNIRNSLFNCVILLFLKR